MKNVFFHSTVIGFLFVFSMTCRAESLSSHLKKLTSVLYSRNLDSIRPFIDPNRIFVELSPKPGAFLSPSQTLAVIESFFHSHHSISFSYILVREDGESGIAAGTLTSFENGRTVHYRVQFGFQKTSRGSWIMTRISIK